MTLVYGETAPSFALPDLNGRMHSLTDYAGRVVIINFWSAECPWVAEADEQLLAWLPAWDGRVALLTVAANANEPIERLRQAMQEHRLPLVLHDRDQRVASQYAALTTPHSYVLDECAVLRYQGAFNDRTFRQRTPTRNYVHEAVTALLAGRTPALTSAAPYGCTLVRAEQV